MATENTGSVKTLAIRLENDVHMQLTLIAQLKGSTITEEIRQALAAHVVQAKASSDLVSQAESAMAEIEREAAARRDVLAQLFGTSDKPRPQGRAR
ncbi:DNA-binding protein [Arthrobacter sp. MYb229]|uniref:DNA-binding protein n=1 Tax=Glutamicibacter arilaitensis TaxID=256701 RepID=A0A4Y8TZ68_9MICC|nr:MULTISPECIES: DNA-binding protein [Micrococcaceae]PRA06569.1 DNA-binding protein [Arthrobacter sp. MYb229]PRB53470.1 DNA-binding protein [Arthrobacter sp. MYb216]TFH57032.1 DNA-binding protein [Glutamicibacter arilaitensis]